MIGLKAHVLQVKEDLVAQLLKQLLLIMHLHSQLIRQQHKAVTTIQLNRTLISQLQLLLLEMAATQQDLSKHQ